MAWVDEQKWEMDWWGNCANTFGEELKQVVYAQKMGLNWIRDAKAGSIVYIDIKGASVIDVGGGPVSLLLKCRNVKGIVIDPGDYPEWTMKRYNSAGITYLKCMGEQMEGLNPVDEVWIYNCLQHTQYPEKILLDSLKLCSTLRIIEPVNTPISDGHPHSFTGEWFEKLLKQKGTLQNINENGFVCDAFYGVFEGYRRFGNPLARNRD